MYMWIFKSFKGLGKIKGEINLLLNTIPDTQVDRGYYTEKVRKYSNACGCDTGAAFLFASLIFYAFREWDKESLLKFIVNGFVFIFLFAFLGKIVGLGIARIKLVMLYYSLKKIKPCQPVQNG